MKVFEIIFIPHDFTLTYLIYSLALLNSASYIFFTGFGNSAHRPLPARTYRSVRAGVTHLYVLFSIQQLRRKVLLHLRRKKNLRELFSTDILPLRGNLNSLHSPLTTHPELVGAGRHDSYFTFDVSCSHSQLTTHNSPLTISLSSQTLHRVCCGCFYCLYTYDHCCYQT